jgi:hypothetical protein
MSLREVARTKDLEGNRRRDLGCARGARMQLKEGRKKHKVRIRRKGGKAGTSKELRDSKGRTWGEVAGGMKFQGPGGRH